MEPLYFRDRESRIECLGPSLDLLATEKRWFALGSCFARNLMRWFDASQLVQTNSHRDIYFNTSSILRQVRIANGSKCMNLIHPSWQIKSNESVRYIDGFRQETSGDSLKTYDENQLLVAKTLRKEFLTADYFLFTLGLSYIWEENIKGEWTTLNRLPPKNMWQSSAFRRRYQRIDEIRKDLTEIISVVSHKPNSHIIFSISPIPMKAAFCGRNVLDADIRSKSNLLAALLEVLDDSTESVHYFDGYEYVKNLSAREDVFQADGRHPKAETVQKVCLRFVNTFFQNPNRFTTIKDFSVPEGLE